MKLFAKPQVLKTLLIAGSVSVMLAGTAHADGEAVYNKACKGCHSTGMMGAPKVGDAADWAARSAQGRDTLDKHAIKGFKGAKGFMPAKGGKSSLSDDEVKAAVTYMVDNSK